LINDYLVVGGVRKDQDGKDAKRKTQNAKRKMAKMAKMATAMEVWKWKTRVSEGVY
jgi:hypothetical protein